MLKKIIYLLTLVIFVASCESLKSVKRGLTGEKLNSTDEFLVKKKDPLILPPDFENLPTPDEENDTSEEILVFENVLETSTEDSSSIPSSDENSILKKIQSQ